MAKDQRPKLCYVLRGLRVDMGFTQMQVAEVLGISQAAYSRLESGEVEASLSKLRALSELFKVPLVDLLSNV